MYCGRNEVIMGCQFVVMLEVCAFPDLQENLAAASNEIISYKGGRNKADS